MKDAALSMNERDADVVLFCELLVSGHFKLERIGQSIGAPILTMKV